MNQRKERKSTITHFFSFHTFDICKNKMKDKMCDV